MSRVPSFLAIFLFLQISIPPTPTFAANILFFHLIATTSHRTSIWPLAEGLADKGHNVTYIFPAEKRDVLHPNIEDITPSKMLPIVRDFVGDFDIRFRLNNTVDDWTWQVFTKCVDLCEAFYDSPEVQEWLARPGLTYDLVMIDASLGECAYGLVHRFKAKHIIFCPVLPGFMWDGFGIIPETSSIPELYFHKKPTEMGFFNRLITTLAPFIFRLAFLNYLGKIEPIIQKKLNDSKIPSLVEFERNTSLLLLNSHFIEDYPMSLPPMIVSYSGLTCGKNNRDKGRKPLPQDISKFINEGNSDGFIYVSFGSSVKISGLPEEIVNKFLSAFSAFPNVKFLWRWTGDEPKNKPDNLMLKKWFPQKDVLNHNNIKGFIMQGGRPSSQEALCYGVPLCIFPIFGDQESNAIRLEHIGVSTNLDITNFTTADLENAIRNLVQNSSSQATRMKEMSAMFQDRPIDPVDNALYWTEYVLRHDTSLLKPLGMKQTWWQRRLLDVYAVLAFGLFVIFGVVLSVIYFGIKLIIRLIGASSKVKNE